MKPLYRTIVAPSPWERNRPGWHRRERRARYWSKRKNRMRR